MCKSKKTFLAIFYSWIFLIFPNCSVNAVPVNEPGISEILTIDQQIDALYFSFRFLTFTDKLVSTCSLCPTYRNRRPMNNLYEWKEQFIEYVSQLGFQSKINFIYCVYKNICPDSRILDRAPLCAITSIDVRFFPKTLLFCDPGVIQILIQYPFGHKIKLII